MFNRKWIWVHLPAVGWAVLLELFGWICPLTPLENWFREQAGALSYEQNFIEHYLLQVIYPGNLTDNIQVLLAFIVILLNICIYYFVLKKPRR